MPPHSSSPRNSLELRLQSQFDPGVIFRGETYFHEEQVTRMRITEEAATGAVKGSESYSVALEWPEAAPGRIGARCTCAHFDGGSFCKHLWAFILAVDEVDGLPAHVAEGGLRLTFDDLSAVISRAATQKMLKSRMAKAQLKVPPQPQEAPSTSPTEIPVQKTTWRDAFEKPQLQTSERILARPSQDAFIVLRSGPGEGVVRFDFFTSFADASGEASAPLPWRLTNPRDTQVTSDAAFNEAVKTIVTLAQGELNSASARGSYSYRHYHAHADPSTRSLDVKLVRFLLPSLLESGRVFASEDRSRAALKNIQFGSLTLKVIDSPEGYVLDGLIEAGGEQVPIQTLKSIASPHLFRYQNGVGFIELNETELAWFSELQKQTLTIPREDAEPFLEAALNQPLKFDLPESLRWARKVTTPKCKVELRTEKGTGLNRYTVDLKFYYGSRVLSHGNPITELPSLEDQCIYSRARTEEDRMFQLLPQQLLSWRRADLPPTVHTQNLIEFVKHVLTAGIPVEIENKKVETADSFELAVSSGVDWFDVDGQAGFSGRWIKYPAILEAINRGERFIPLPDNSVGLITDQMAKRLEKLAGFAEKAGEKLRFSHTQGILLSALLEDDGSTLKLDAKFTSLRKKIEEFAGVKEAKAPPSFVGKLRKYQREGLGWLEFLESFGLGGILADDMGLGKTIQCLAFLEERRSGAKNKGPSLLLAPKSLLENWKNEARTFTPELKVLIHAGLDRDRDHTASALMEQDLVVTTYQTLLRDIEFLRQIQWNCVIADEAQAIKNPKALISKAIKLLPAQFRLAMTGTPIENSILDLFSISDFVNPGFLNGRRQSSNLKIDDDTRAAVSAAFKPVVLRRTKKQVLTDLPEKTEQLISVTLEAKQLKVYNDLKKFYQSQLLQEVRQNGVKKSQIQILAALTRLRQAALHPGLIDPNHAQTKSSKFEVVLEMLSEITAEGHRVLIFSQFTALLGLLKTELEANNIQYCYLDGQTTKRDAVVSEFKTSDAPVFLISLKAGGVGLNLVEADYVFLLDPWWNPAVEAQAIDRVHRIGQKRAVNAYRFIAKDTVEEKILELQNSKKGLADEIIGKEGSSLKSLSAQDIEGLFS